MHPDVHRSSIYASQDMETTYMSVNRGMDTNVIHTYSRTLLSHKKRIMPFAATWMDLENVILSEVGQAEKEKYDMILLVCGI